jgi:HEAT repeat protein
MDDVDQLITLVQVPAGDDATLRLRDQYVRTLLGRGDEAEARVTPLVQSGNATNMPALMALLAAFESERAADVLEQRMQAGPESLSEAAADALATHPTRWAIDALRRGLQSRQPAVELAALSALRRVHDPTPCELITPLLVSADRSVRFHAIHLAWDSRCLGESLARDLLQKESDPELQAFLRTLVDSGSRQ